MVPRPQMMSLAWLIWRLGEAQARQQIEAGGLPF